MNYQSKLNYNLGCVYILDNEIRCRYITNRPILFRLQDELMDRFSTDYLE